MDWLWHVASSLDLSFPKGLLGQHFGDMVGIMSILFGGTLLLFSWRHHAYFLGVIGFLAGAFLGLLFKAQVAPHGTMAHFLYILVCGVGMAAVLVLFQRLVGMALGGFLTALLITTVRPDLIEGGRGNAGILALAFLLGGGLGALFPRLFYILTTSLFGAAFITHGITEVVLPLLLPEVTFSNPRVVHALVFVPAAVFGVGYQVFTTREEPVARMRSEPSLARG